MEFKHKIGKNEFRIICNKSSILKELEDEIASYEEGVYVGYLETGGDGYLSKDQYLKNIEDIKCVLDDYLEDKKLIEFIERVKKKKDGTFYKGRVVETARCDNCTYFEEWHNTWTYNELKVKAIDDTILSISYSQKVDTPG